MNEYLAINNPVLMYHYGYLISVVSKITCYLYLLTSDKNSIVWVYRGSSSYTGTYLILM